MMDKRKETRKENEFDVIMKFLRALNGWTQKELTRRSGHSISQIESHHFEPRSAILADVARALDVTSKELLAQEPLRIAHMPGVITAVRDLMNSESLLVPKAMRDGISRSLEAGTLNPLRWYVGVCTPQFVEFIAEDPAIAAEEPFFTPYLRGSDATRRLGWSDRQRIHGAMDRGSVASYMVDGKRHVQGYEVNRLLAEQHHRFFAACTYYYRHLRREMPDNVATREFLGRVRWVHANGREADDWKIAQQAQFANSILEGFFLAAHTSYGPVDPLDVLSPRTQAWLKEKWDDMLRGKPLTPRE